MAKYSSGVDKATKGDPTTDNKGARGTMSHEYCGDGEKSTSKPGSHQKSHEKLGGFRKAIQEGSPEELEAYHRKGNGGDAPKEK